LSCAGWQAQLDDLRRQHPEALVGEYIEVSIKTGRNVDLALRYMVASVMAHISAKQSAASSGAAAAAAAAAS
jgi:hypothetical protein